MSREEIIAYNKKYNIETIFYYDDSDILGYSEGNTIYLNLHGKKSLEIVNRHELFHFFETTDKFIKIKDLLISKLSNIEEIREEYSLKYMGLYTEEEIANGIIDIEIIIDILSNNSKYSTEEIINQGEEILTLCVKEVINKRYLSLALKNNIKNMKELSKWEKIFAENYYGQVNYDGMIPNMSDGKDKVEAIRKSIKEELNKLYNLNEEYFRINVDSKEVIREYESELKALDQRGEKDRADYLRLNKVFALQELANMFSNKQYEEYKHIVSVINGTNYEDSFKVLMLRETLMKTYKKDDDKTLINKRKQHETIQGHMLLNETTLDIIYHKLDDYDNFGNLYFASVAIFYNVITEESEATLEGVKTHGKGRWIKFEGKKSNPETYIENVQKLSTLVSNTPWCTKTLASTQLEEGDFYVFVDLENKPHIAVKLRGKSIDEVRGIKNKDSQELEEEYRDVALSFLEENKEIENGKEWLEKEEWNKRLIQYVKDIDGDIFDSNDVPFLIEDLFREDYKSHVNKNSNLEELKSRLDLIKDKIAVYYNCKEEEIVTTDYMPLSNETICPCKIIIGEADFRASQITSLGGLQHIGGDAIFRKSKITSLDQLQSIGECAFFEDSKITSLGQLKSIGRDAIFQNSKITSLGQLQSIGGSAKFQNSKITSLGELQTIEGDAFFEDSQIISLDQLQSIGGSANFSNSKITSLGRLQSIRENVIFEKSKITSLGQLQSIGGSAKFQKSKITSLGQLQSIGQSADFRNSQITSLGQLQSIGKNANFENSKITSLGELQSIGGDAIFQKSKITSLGQLQSIGRNAIFNNSEITSLGCLRNIVGDASFSKNKITDFSQLVINGDAIFEDIIITDFSKLPTIGGKAYFNNPDLQRHYNEYMLKQGTKKR